MIEQDARRSLDAPDSSTPALVSGLVTTLTLTTAFGALALGIPFWWIAFPVGFGAVMPLAVGASKAWADRATVDGPASERATASASDRETSERDDALATLRERYARGAIDEAEFERRVEGLLATEDAGDRTDPLYETGSGGR